MYAPSVLLSSQQWAQATFGTVDLGDERRGRRAVHIGQLMAEHPQASLPQQGSPADLQATYRFLHSSHSSYEELLAPHWQQTREQMREPGRVLLLQDTTELDYHQHPSTTGLGPVGTGSHHGFLLQSVLAVGAHSQSILGLAHQEPFVRIPAPKKESKQQRWQRERESQVWERSVQAIGSPPQSCQWIHVGDRYSDIFSFLLTCREQGCDFLIRAFQDRCVDLLVQAGEEPAPARSHHPERPREPNLHLLEVVKQMPIRASQWIDLKSSQKHAARRVHLAISWRALRLLPPRTREATHWHPLVVWVIHAWEADPPAGVEPLDWLLLSSVPTTTATEAQEHLSWYARRWIIEDYHQGLKTGCRIEERELRDYAGLRTLLGLLAPVAVRLLQLRWLARQRPQAPASQIFPSEVVTVVAHLSHRQAETMTVEQCSHAIARQGGYLGRKGDGLPGWKTLWLGWTHIQTLLEGIHLAPLLSNQLKL